MTAVLWLPMLLAISQATSAMQVAALALCKHNKARLLAGRLTVGWRHNRARQLFWRYNELPDECLQARFCVPSQSPSSLAYPFFLLSQLPLSSLPMPQVSACINSGRQDVKACYLHRCPGYLA